MTSAERKKMGEKMSIAIEKAFARSSKSANIRSNAKSE